MKRFVIFLGDRVAAELQSRADTRGVSPSEVVRKILADVFYPDTVVFKEPPATIPKPAKIELGFPRSTK